MGSKVIAHLLESRSLSTKAAGDGRVGESRGGCPSGSFADRSRAAGAGCFSLRDGGLGNWSDIRAPRGSELAPGGSDARRTGGCQREMYDDGGRNECGDDDGEAKGEEVWIAESGRTGRTVL